MSFIKLLLLITVTFLSIWVGGLLWFKSQIATSIEPAHTNTDAIVVLTGGSDRLREGIVLLKQGKATMLFVSGVGEGVTMADTFRTAGFPPDDATEFGGKVELGRIAKDTRQNAIEVAKWMQEKKFNSMRLVTSNYHMGRSLAELRFLAPEMIILPHPVIPGHVILDKWWKYPGTRELIIQEYNKYLATSIHLSMGGE